MSTALGEGFGYFTGTSAAAAKASALIAMTLEARPSLTWEDIQQIIVFSSSFSGLERKGEKNGAGLLYDPYFGFGLMNATAMIQLAKDWTSYQRMNVTVKFTTKQNKMNNKRSFQYSQKSTQKSCLSYIEHVVAHIEYIHTADRIPVITLCSPQKTCSILLHGNLRNGDGKEKLTDNSEIIISWDFMSVQFWGENPVGRWSLEISNSDGHTFIKNVSVTFYGTYDLPFSKNFNLTFRRQRKRARCAVDSKNGPSRPSTEESSDGTNLKTYLPIFVPVGAILCIVIMVVIAIFFRKTEKLKVSSAGHKIEQTDTLMKDYAIPQ
ncbi:neuroendocrine convertase 1-like isoform X1 [Ruditapes philippinarum]|uniref:neuroendocrine convertase 1-like isoform X1 n=1 Tax=Ruditapes philippinarum TaxID=129788 RepID=UPI00295AE9D1|nr:neuroendocrine convertase 1-like isoform X1 [Ruditapes philippinarum]